MDIYHDKANERLVYAGETASTEFWDRYWESDNFRRGVEQAKKSRSGIKIIKTVKKHLPDPDGIILEGGCGRGHLVYLMQAHGLKVVGVDTASNTLEQAKIIFPELDIRFGDVRSLKFQDSYFSGYWSGGVIEHFWEGYGDIMAEMRRVLTNGGIVFLTFPYMSPLRRLKARLKLYKKFEGIDKSNFYQFAFNPRSVINDFEHAGFQLLEQKPLPGIYGLINDLPWLGTLLGRLNAYDGKSLLIRVFRYALGEVVAPTCAHTVLLVFRNVK